MGQIGADQSELISASLRKVLNVHGHGFHHAVIRRVDELFSSKRSRWIFDGAEFPVLAAGHTTHVDFILRSGQTVVVCECKRADAAKALWCFARSPYTWRNASSQELIFDDLECNSTKEVSRKPHFGHTQREIYHLGFELKTGQKGDGGGQSSSAIDQAISQVQRGTSGLINHFYNAVRASDYSWLKLPDSNRTIRFVPAIFTTAQIWVTDVDLGAADLTTGELANGVVQAQQIDWVWFTNHRSPGLKPDINLEREGNPFGELAFDLRRDFARSVAIISPSGIDNFLTMNLEE